MKVLGKLFGGLNITWKRVILFALIAGAYTGIINQIYILQDTSLQDIAVTLECWILFAVIIAANAKTARESAVKIFVFFLISQPTVFLVELPMLGVHDALMYYRLWIVPTILTLPGGYLAWYAKKDSVFGAVVLSCATAMLALLMSYYGWRCLRQFPSHLLTAVFIFLEIAVFVLTLQKRAVKRLIVLCITAAALFAGIWIQQHNRIEYTVQLPEGEWICTSELANGSTVSVQDGYFVYSYVQGQTQDVTLIFENEAGETYSVRSEYRNGSFWLIPE